MKKLITVTIASIIGALASNNLSLDQIKQHLQQTADLSTGSIPAFEQIVLFQIANKSTSSISLRVTVKCSDVFGPFNKSFNSVLQPGELMRKLYRDLGDEFNSVQARNGDKVTIDEIEIAQILHDSTSGCEIGAHVRSIDPGETFDIS